MFLIVTRSFPPEIGGMQTLMEGLSKSLLSHGPVKIFTYEHDESDAYDKNSSMSIERIKGIKLFKKYRMSNLVNKFIVDNDNIRLIVADHWKSLELLKIENIKKTKTICLLHSKEINHEKKSNLNRRVIESTNKADFIIANSNFTKDLAIKVGINTNKLSVIFPGVEKPKSISSEAKNKAINLYGDSFPKIITVARLDKRKGHDNILMTIKNLKTIFPKIKYISIGFGEEKNNLIKLAKELNLKDEILFLSNIDQELKNALVSESNLFLMPSRIEKKSVEGFGISFIEAATLGVASIGGKDGGASDAIKNNVTGIICDGNNLSSIYDSINIFFKNKNFINFGINAKKRSEDFYWNKVVKNYLKLIN